jgi:hypothetical protein
MRYGKPKIANNLGFRLTLIIYTVPDQIPMFNFFVSMPSMNSPTTSRSSFYNNFSNIIIIVFYYKKVMLFHFIRILDENDIPF